MRTITRGLIGSISVAMLLGSMTLVTPLGYEAEASGKKHGKQYVKKYVKKHIKEYFGNHGGHYDDGPPPESGPTNTDIEALILMLKDQNDMVKDQLTTLQTTVDNLPTGGGGGTAGPCDVPPVWDENIADATTRFVSVLGGTAYCDQETGVVWEASPGDTSFPADAVVDSTDTVNWDTARGHCLNKSVGGTEGWRLPSVVEFKSLADSSNSSPALPTSHPFNDIQSATDTFYWTATSDANEGSTSAWALRFEGGEALLLGKGSVLFVWCARSGMNADAY